MENRTLGYHRDMARAVLGESSPAVAYMDKRIAEAPNGRDEEVIVDESQMVFLLMSMHLDAVGELPTTPR